MTNTEQNRQKLEILVFPLFIGVPTDKRNSKNIEGYNIFWLKLNYNVLQGERYKIPHFPFSIFFRHKSLISIKRKRKILFFIPPASSEEIKQCGLAWSFISLVMLKELIMFSSWWLLCLPSYWAVIGQIPVT